MALTKYKLGDLIEPRDVRNFDNLLTLDNLKGISTNKEFIETKADMDGVNLSSYKVVNEGEFAYVADTSRRGEKIALAFNKSSQAYLISSIYTVFRVSRKELILPDYLFMYFNRPEFDRYARFNSWGSARETFSWEDMCDIDIELPDLPTQQKYVDIYNAMVTNQQIYERGLEDLKLVCDGYIDKIKHTSPYKPIRMLLKEVDIRNTNGEITFVHGINITKQFMPSVADTDNVDLTKYKKVKKNQFAFSGMQTGRDECIRIALNRSNEDIIVSPAYTVFEVLDTTILEEYIMLWFSRKQSDRRGWFMSDSSIRSNLDLDRLYETQIPIPAPQIQQAIVNIYKVYIERKEINEKLKAQIKDICPILIKGSLEEGK
ncbi:MAG: restriction endonuclease subunit S [Clostridia bacterium]|nr:restriction endonuclease subunit S [Clostridia bacterium]MBO5925215.1 restriction endonuclease subunit S [Clostridia bacterium]